MKVREILNENNETVENLMWLIDGSAYAAEIEEIKQRLAKHGTEPTLENVKRHFINHLLLPMELMRDPEREIILRAKRTEFGD